MSVGFKPDMLRLSSTLFVYLSPRDVELGPFSASRACYAKLCLPMQVFVVACGFCCNSWYFRARLGEKCRIHEADG